MLTSFSPKTDETDGMMDRPEENQTNSQRLLARRLVELSEGTAAGGAARRWWRRQQKGVCLHPSYPFWWMDDWLHSPKMMGQPTSRNNSLWNIKCATFITIWQQPLIFVRFAVNFLYLCSDSVTRGKSLLESNTTFRPDWQPHLIFLRFISSSLTMCSNSMAIG